MEILFKNPVLSTAYLPPAEYFFVLAHSESATIDLKENYQKQSYRTRCRIYAAGGVETLQVPVRHDAAHISGTPHTLKTEDVAIDYDQNWIHKHTLALISAYRSAPFFEYYWDGIEAIFKSRPTRLSELNTSLTKLIMEELGIRCRLNFTDSYLSDAECDLRGRIHPKYKGETLFKEKGVVERPYYQVFSSKCGFIPNLTILDLLFHEGPEACSFLR